MNRLITCLCTFLFLVLLTGIVYPLALTHFAAMVMPKQATGSLVKNGDDIVGSALIGQQFKNPRYFWPRPSATGYNTMPSNGSHLSPASAELKELVASRQDKWQRYSSPTTAIPPDLLFASGSGLDPHISVDAAFFQASRVAEARHIPKEKVIEIILHNIETSFLGFLGQKRVNVLLLNQALDKETLTQVRHD